MFVENQRKIKFQVDSLGLLIFWVIVRQLCSFDNSLYG